MQIKDLLPPQYSDDDDDIDTELRHLLDESSTNCELGKAMSHTFGNHVSFLLQFLPTFGIHLVPLFIKSVIILFSNLSKQFSSDDGPSDSPRIDEISSSDTAAPAKPSNVRKKVR